MGRQEDGRQPVLLCAPGISVPLAGKLYSRMPLFSEALHGRA